MTIHFPEVGPTNTKETLSLCLERAEELGIRTIIVATTRGDTGALASETFRGYNVVVVTHSTGLQQPDHQEVTEENRAVMERNGAHILTATHALGGLGRAIRRKFNTIQIEEIVANTLRIVGQGTKVVCEIAVMAADAGLARTDEDAIVISGSGRGADTAMVVQPVHAQDFFDLRIKEIICRPRLRSVAEVKQAQAARA